MEDVTDSEEESEDNDSIPMDPIDSSDLSGDESEIEMESRIMAAVRKWKAT
jgi:hypothetical protein